MMIFDAKRGPHIDHSPNAGRQWTTSVNVKTAERKKEKASRLSVCFVFPGCIDVFVKAESKNGAAFRRLSISGAPTSPANTLNDALCCYLSFWFAKPCRL
jgi:hypothetical protein